MTTPLLRPEEVDPLNQDRRPLPSELGPDDDSAIEAIAAEMQNSLSWRERIREWIQAARWLAIIIRHRKPR
jgi:hypothetical protein